MRLRAKPTSALLLSVAMAAATLASGPAAVADEQPTLTGIVQVSDLPWTSMSNGWGPVERDMSNGSKEANDANRQPLTVGGVVYAKGLGTHATSEITYDLNKACRQFLSYVGIDDTQGSKGRVDFKVLVDGIEKFSAESRGSDGPILVNLDVAGASTLTLRANEGSEGNGNDHADWGDAKLNCTDAYIANPLQIRAASDTRLDSLVAGDLATVVVSGVLPQSAVQLSFRGTSVSTAVANDFGEATAKFVVPAGAAVGAGEILATGVGKFNAPTSGTITAAVTSISTGQYFVDCSAAIEGDGTKEAPYNSLSQVNSHGSFLPGESIRFRAGVDCVGQLAPQGSGLKGHPISVLGYGDGAMPTINGNGAVAAIQITNASYWTISGLHVINPATDHARRVGILFNATTAADQGGVVVTENHVEDVAGWSNKTGSQSADFPLSAGIMVQVQSGSGAYAGITITNNRVNDTGGGGIKLAADTNKYHTNVLISGNKIDSVGGDGIVVHNADEPLVEYNSALNLGMGKHPFVAGNFAGMWPYNSRNTMFQYNVVGNSVTSTYDSTAWDCDIQTVGTCTFQYNYSYGNAGGFYLNCVSGCGNSSTTTKVILRYNVSQDDCRLGGASGGPGVHYIYNNTFYCPSRDFLDDMSGPRYFANNAIVAPSGNLKSGLGTNRNNAYSGGIKPPSDEVGAVIGDPKFLAGGSGQTTLSNNGYQLLEGSPLIGAGTPMADNGGRDYFGNPLSDGAPNIGAYAGPGVARQALTMEQAFNQTAVARSANPRNGAVTVDRRTFSAESLADAGLTIGQSRTANGVDFIWHGTAVGTPDVVKAAGQRIAITGQGKTLLVVGFSTGTKAEGEATVNYTDGSSQKVTISLPNWLSTNKSASTGVLAQSAFHQRHTQSYVGGAATIVKITEPASIFTNAIPLAAGRTVASIDLPEGSPLVDEGLSIFNLAVGNAALAPTVVAPESAVAGQSTTFTGKGFAPNETVKVSLSTSNLDLGTFIADNAGVVIASWAVPEAFAAGSQTIQFEGVSSGLRGEASFVVTGAQVESQKPTGPTPSGTTNPTKVPTNGADDLAATGALTAAPLVLALLLLLAGGGAFALKRRRLNKH
ncbi:NPCBM/NEW2 domain-containing protein [Arthrobacter sp. GMC3]|uniref:NPCBM/NEW2 domain-containing protein n=1 Tax=Arthrobacter sp. GMC3 TaxID=2058894 RepID=UPI000CE38718|nr:NPCBM/NEW2 domain-containing protein [Arthrobacter sp. GMC3]